MDSVEETLRKAKDVEERFKKFMERKVEQDKSIQETFKKIDRTQETLKQTRETLGSIDQLYVRLENILASTIDNAVKSIQKHSLFKVAEPGFVPNRVQAKTVGEMLKGKKRIMVLTGAGISAASGIPTFRGQNGYWKQDKVEVKNGESSEKVEPTTILTYKFYSQNPKFTWKWLHQFYNIKIKAKPNRAHTALNDILEELARKGKEVSLVTQNIDNFHVETQLLTKKNNKNFKGYPIYQIHGNILKIRCDKCCMANNDLLSHPYEKYIDLLQTKDKVQCPKCEDALRPHIMFFDQIYTEYINRCDTIRSFLKDTDALLVIGTALQTGLANEIVQTAFEEQKQIVEINTACEIRRSKVWWMQCKAQVALEEIKAHVLKK